VELALGGFRVGGVGAENFAGSAEPVEPGSELGAKLIFEFGAKVLGERGTFAARGDGNLEIAALDDGAVVEVAVLVVVDSVAENVAFVGFAIDEFVETAERGGGDDEEFAVEVVWLEGSGEPSDLPVVDAFGEFGRESGGDHGDARAGGEEAGDFGRGDGAATDDEDGAVVEFEESRKEGHRSSTR
jgi:hypothetical protein